MIYDPNDVVCEINSPITDIRNRYQVQINLWDTVMKLRNGNYYDASSVNEFLTNLNKCRNNIFDNADLAYSQDDGAILRKLLSVFSLRPTVVTVKPIWTVTSFLNPFMMGGLDTTGAQAVMPFNNQPVYTVTQLPMITFTIPPKRDDTDEVKELKSATDQTVWMNDGQGIIPKEQSVIYSKEVLIFYVNRRVQRIQIKTFANPLTFSQLPLTMNNFELLNDYPINVPPRMNLKYAEEAYDLRSVVISTQTSIMQPGKQPTNVVTGSSGLILQHYSNSSNNKLYNPTHWLYDPLGASLPVKHEYNDSGVGYFTNKPLSIIDAYFPSDGSGDNNHTFFGKASTAGTIFIYAKASGFSQDDNVMLL
jgi:hypothetical protein